LPATTEYPAFLSAVQNVANVAGVSLSAWTPQDEAPEQFYARVPMKIELQGRFHQIAKFFYQVGQLDRIINIENIAIKEPAVEGDEVLLKVDALATAFHSIEQKAVAPAPGGKQK
jgi:type IV pilus assembly protein PilO